MSEFPAYVLLLRKEINGRELPDNALQIIEENEQELVGYHICSIKGEEM